MKHLFTLLCLIAMNAVFAQSAPLSDVQLNRFLARVGFDPSPAELSALAGLSQTQLAQRLVAQAVSNTATPPAPVWVSEPMVTMQMRGQMSREARMDYRSQQNRQTLAMREWWLRGMIATPTPLRERMVLFWHNHFPSSQQKVIDSHMLWQQHSVMRQHALGDFKTLLKAVVQSPAMLDYLDAPQNRVKAPNENLARELMELFTLGEGNYSEADVKQAARALTGWVINGSNNTFAFTPRLHDTQPKTLFGRSIDNGDDLLNLLLTQPQTAKWVTGKLWKEMISPVPDAARVEVLAKQFYVNGYDIAALMSALLSEPALLADSTQATLVKSPVELLVGSVRRFGIAVDNERVLLPPLNAMGQVLFAHPSVKGWATGEGWISANTLLARKQAVAALIAAPRAMSETNPTGMLMGMSQSPSSAAGAQAQPLRAGAIAFKPEAWLAALQMPAQRSLNTAEQAKLTAHVLYCAPAAPLDNSLEALPALKALMSDIAYQVK